jgi:hypothetical protein
MTLTALIHSAYRNLRISNLVSSASGQSGTGMKRSADAGTSTGMIRYRTEIMNEYRYQTEIMNEYRRHRPRCQCPAMDITPSVSSNIGYLHYNYKAPVTFKALLDFVSQYETF